MSKYNANIAPFLILPFFSLFTSHLLEKNSDGIIKAAKHGDLKMVSKRICTFFSWCTVTRFLLLYFLFITLIFEKYISPMV